MQYCVIRNSFSVAIVAHWFPTALCTQGPATSPPPLPHLHAGDVVFPIQGVDMLNFVLQICSILGGLKEITIEGVGSPFQA